MITVAQMIEWLETLPPHAEVQCLVEQSKGYYTSTEMRAVDFVESSVLDYSTPDYLERYPAMNGRVIVEICGE